MIVRQLFIANVLVILFPMHGYGMRGYQAQNETERDIRPFLARNTPKSGSSNVSSSTSSSASSTSTPSFCERCCTCFCSKVVPEIEKDAPLIIEDIVIAITDRSKTTAEIIDIIKILSQAISDINTPSASGETPLVAACATGNETVVKKLLKMGSDPNQPNNAGVMPLHAACVGGHAKVVRHLIDFGVDPATALQVQPSLPTAAPASMEEQKSS